MITPTSNDGNGRKKLNRLCPNGGVSGEEYKKITHDVT